MGYNLYGFMPCALQFHSGCRHGAGRYFQVLDAFGSHGVRHQVLALPCAHYTTGQTPFKYIDGFAMAGFAAKNL